MQRDSVQATGAIEESRESGRHLIDNYTLMQRTLYSAHSLLIIDISMKTTLAP